MDNVGTPVIIFKLFNNISKEKETGRNTSARTTRKSYYIT